MNVGPRGTGRLTRIFRDELNLFLASVRIGPVTEVEDRRAGIIGFIAAFAPEAIDAPARARLLREWVHLRGEPDFDKHHWWRVAYSTPPATC